MLTERTSLILNLGTLQLQGAASRVDVTDPESQLLCALAAAPGCRIEGTDLRIQLGLPVDEAGKRALGVRVVRLRKKLLAAGASDPTIKSIRGTGYQLCVPLVVHTRVTTPSVPSLAPSSYV